MYLAWEAYHALSERADRLLEQVARGDDDLAASELLKEFFSGYPAVRLKGLLRSKNEAAVKAGAWIASELGVQAAPVVGELVALLVHASRRVRFFALDAILSCAGPGERIALAAAVGTIRDGDEAVRWKAMNFLARASSVQLASSLQDLEDNAVAVRVEWLLDSTRRGDTVAVIEQLKSDDPLGRRVAAAAAVRIAPHDRAALRYAAESMDSEVRSFAEEHLRSPAIG